MPPKKLYVVGPKTRRRLRSFRAGMSFAFTSPTGQLPPSIERSDSLFRVCEKFIPLDAVFYRDKMGFCCSAARLQPAREYDWLGMVPEKARQLRETLSCTWAMKRNLNFEGWIRSNKNALLSPPAWPEDITKAFGLLEPSPFYLANALPQGKYDEFYDYPVAFLVAFASGMPIDLIARLQGRSEKNVKALMLQGVKQLLQNDWFILRVARPDFSLIPGLSSRPSISEVKSSRWWRFISKGVFPEGPPIQMRARPILIYPEGMYDDQTGPFS